MSTHPDIIRAASWRDIPESVWPWPNFTPYEMRSHDDGSVYVDWLFMEKLQNIRAACGFPLPVNSGYRTPAHNRSIGGTPDGPHTTGHAVDIKVHGVQAYELIELAVAAGITGVGVGQRAKDRNQRFLHLDDLSSKIDDVGRIIRPRPWIWSY